MIDLSDEARERIKEMLNQGSVYKDVKETLKSELDTDIDGETFQSIAKEFEYENEGIKRLFGELAPDSPVPREKPPKKPEINESECDTSPTARAINQTIAQMTPCPTGELDPEGVQEINFGGALVQVLEYYGVGASKNPLFTLLLRGVQLAIYVYQRCFMKKRAQPPSDNESEFGEEI